VQIPQLLFRECRMMGRVGSSGRSLHAAVHRPLQPFVEI